MDGIVSSRGGGGIKLRDVPLPIKKTTGDNDNEEEENDDDIIIERRKSSSKITLLSFFFIPYGCMYVYNEKKWEELIERSQINLHAHISLPLSLRFLVSYFLLLIFPFPFIHLQPTFSTSSLPSFVPLFNPILKSIQ